MEDEKKTPTKEELEQEARDAKFAAQMDIMMELDYGTWIDDCMSYFHLKRQPTRHEYELYLKKTKMKEVFEIAGF